MVYDDERKIHDVDHMLPYEFQIAAVTVTQQIVRILSRTLCWKS